MSKQQWPKPAPHCIDRLSAANMAMAEPGHPEPINNKGFLIGRVIRLEATLQHSPVADSKDTRRPPGTPQHWVVSCKNREELLAADGGRTLPQTVANERKNEASASFLRDLGLDGLQIFFREDMLMLESFASWADHRGVPGLPPRLMAFVRRFRRFLCPIEEFLAMTDAILDDAPAANLAAAEQVPLPLLTRQRRSCLAAIRRFFRSTHWILKDELERTRRSAPPSRTVPSPHVDFCELLFPPDSLLPFDDARMEQRVDREVVVCLNNAEQATDFSRDVFLLASHAPDIMTKGRGSSSYEPEMHDIQDRYRRCEEVCVSRSSIRRDPDNSGPRRIICVFRRKPAASTSLASRDPGGIGLAY